MKQEQISVAIDGPAGAGKSTIAKRLAKELSMIYVDTGAMYRTAALFSLREGVMADREDEIAAMMNRCEIDIAFREEDQSQRMLLGGEDVTGLIRTEEVSRQASAISVYPKVRHILTEKQRQIARKSSVVMDGRDIGTVVLPDAKVKIFLTASIEARAKRRYEELLAKGEEADISVIERDMKERDERDSTRKEAPLKKAEDAILLDTSDLNVEEVLEKIRKIIQEKMNA